MVSVLVRVRYIESVSDMSLRLCLLNVSCDEVMVHEEESNSNEVESDVHSMTQSYSLVKGCPQCTHSSILQL